jgi:hypothetical protein
MPNLLGRGERFQVDYSYGSKRSSNVNVSLSKPIHNLGYKESSMPNTYSIPTVTTSGKLFQPVDSYSLEVVELIYSASLTTNHSVVTVMHI